MACTAFLGVTRIASGALAPVARAARSAHAADGQLHRVLMFNDQTGDTIDIDLRADVPGDAPAVADSSVEATVHSSPARGPGRPRLGVVAREVTLLPRHWEWLRHQPGGASVAMRKLVEAARRTHGGKDRVRSSQEAAYRFMSAMAGDEPGFEEACRALFAGDRARFDQQVANWPADVREYASRLAAGAWTAGE